MLFECQKEALLSDTAVPDVFLSDIMPSLPSDAVKVYLYCLLLAKSGKSMLPEELAECLDLTVDAVNACFLMLEKEQILLKTGERITLLDIKAREIDRLFRRKTTSEPDVAIARTEGNKHRNQCISHINQMFFQGVMSPSWYTVIDHWFDVCQFDEDVMVHLFQYCHERDALNPKYMEKVSASWSMKGVRTHWDLDKYLKARDNQNSVNRQIVRSLRLNRNLTEFEENLSDVWVNQYGYGMDVISLAIERTTGKTNPSFKYIHGVLSGWFKDGIKTAEDAKTHLESQAKRILTEKIDKEKADFGRSKRTGTTRRDNFEQRVYDDAFFDELSNASLAKGEKKP